MSDYNLFLKKVELNLHLYPTLRYGQVLFNSLEEVDPKLANEIRGAVLDPFYKTEEKGDPIFQPFFDYIHREMDDSKKEHFIFESEFDSFENYFSISIHFWKPLISIAFFGFYFCMGWDYK